MENMTTSPNNLRVSIPLNLTGNVSERQAMILRHSMEEILNEALEKAIAHLDQQTAQFVIEAEAKLKEELVSLVSKAIQDYTVSDKYHDEAVGSERTYPENYRVRPVEAQVSALKAAFPKLQVCNEKIARRPLPDGAEDWFAIPRWQALAPTYGEALDMVLEAIGSRRRFSNRIRQRMNAAYLRQSERTVLADKILCQQQSNNDILVIAAQAGMLHRGSSARRTRVEFASNEFGLGAFAVAAMLLTTPERLSASNTLMIDCSGDEYSAGGDNFFDRVPLFDYDISGIEFSIFYEDRARNLWGSPTGFIFKME